MTGTGILTQRCDPYGAESSVRLLGGMYPESHRGNIMWHCDNRADAGVFTMVCKHGHRGQPMPLCTEHRVEIAKRQSGLCTRCAFPPEAAAMTHAIEQTQRELGQARQGFNDSLIARLTQKLNDQAAQMTEMYQRGVIQKNSLRLEEVS